MNKKRKSIGRILAAAFLSVFTWTHAEAQFGLGAQGNARMGGAQQFNPAYAASDEFAKFRVSFDGGVWINNSHTGISGIIGDSGYIDQAAKDRVISDLGKGFTASGGYRLGLANVNVKAGSAVLQFSLADVTTVGAGFNNANTAGLILQGNGPYAGQTVSDEDIYARFYRARELGIGAAISSGNLQIGGRLKVLQGVSALDAEISQFSLFTDSLGLQLDITADYDLASTYNNSGSGFSFRGIGAGIDLGIVYEINEKMSVNAAVLDAGMISWRMKQYKHSVNVQDFEGVEISSLFASNIPDQIEEEVDSLRDLLLVDSVDTRNSMLTPVRVIAGFNYSLNEKSVLVVNLVYSPLKMGYRTRLPLLSVGYFMELAPEFRLGATLSGLGNEMYGLGLSGSYRIKFGDKSIDLLVTGDNLLGLIPGVGRGLGLMGAVGFNW